MSDLGVWILTASEIFSLLQTGGGGVYPRGITSKTQNSKKSFNTLRIICTSLDTEVVEIHPLCIFHSCIPLKQNMLRAYQWPHILLFLSSIVFGMPRMLLLGRR